MRPRTAERCELGSGGSPFIKRIVGLPGELISERKGTIFVDGKRLIEPYVDPSHRVPRRELATGRPGPYFVLGDNRIHICDSRTWGTVPRGTLIGPMIAHVPASKAPAAPLVPGAIEGFRNRRTRQLTRISHGVVIFSTRRPRASGMRVYSSCATSSTSSAPFE